MSIFSAKYSTLYHAFHAAITVSHFTAFFATQFSTILFAQFPTIFTAIRIPYNSTLHAAN